MAVEFNDKLIMETQSTGIFSVDGAVQIYSPWSGEGWTTTGVSDTTIQINRISHAGGVSGFTITDPINLGSMDRDGVATIGTALHPSSELFRVLVGRSNDPDSQSEAWLCVDLVRDTTTTSYIFSTVTYTLRIANPGGLDVVETLGSRSVQTYSKQGYQYYTNLGFGVDFFRIPGREEQTDQTVMTLFVYSYSDDTTMTYDVTPYNLTQYAFPQENDGLGYYKYMEVGLDLARLADKYDMYFATDVISPEAGPASEEDGYGEGGDMPSFDDSSDTIDLPDTPLIGVTNVGFVNVYKTGSQSLQNLGVELFPPLTYTPPAAITGSDVTNAVVNGFNAIVTFLANIPSFFDQITANTYINYIIDCHVLPVTPGGGTSENIKVGSKTLQATGDRLSNDYVDVDCGTISLAEYYTNFADFLTSFKLFLPFVGFVPARPEWFYRESLNVTYRFNVIDGSFMAFVRSTGKYVNNNNSGKTIVGQYGGNACVHLPITGATYASMVSGLVGAGAGMMVGAAAGNVPAIATSAISAATQHGDIAQSNAYASSVAFLGCRRPFVLIERPVSNYSETYSKEKGIPSNISRKLSRVSGFSVIGDVHLDGITATDAEKAEIERLLHEGVIL